jgi:hypothetical protein
VCASILIRCLSTRCPAAQPFVRILQKDKRGLCVNYRYFCLLLSSPFLFDRPLLCSTYILSISSTKPLPHLLRAGSAGKEPRPSEDSCRREFYARWGGSSSIGVGSCGGWYEQLICERLERSFIRAQCRGMVVKRESHPPLPPPRPA